MPTFQSFEDILAWKESRILIRKVRNVCKRERVNRDFAFVDQVTRSARSVAANIAEGFESTSVLEFITFLGFAKRSAGETRSHAYDALDEHYITQEEFSDIANLTIKISKMLASLMAYLQSSGVDKKKKRIMDYDSEVETSKLVNQ